jgi:serine/threonine protein kinase
MLTTTILQPANVLISSSGRVKLADFGIVSRQPLHDNEDDTILHHTVIGTVRYMSPERLHGRPYTRSSDVWSVGLLLLELVRGGCSPFEDVSSVVRHHFCNHSNVPSFSKSDVSFAFNEKGGTRSDIR